MGRAVAEPQRRCVGCGRSASKLDLLRLVAVAGVAVPDPGGRRGGRGAYICSDPACLERATRRGALGRALRQPVGIGDDVPVLPVDREAPGSPTPECNRLESIG